jgi:hypothetical protein
MKTLSIALLAVASISSATVPMVAEAGRYYTAREVRECRSDFGETMAGAGIGCAVGIGIGAIFGGRGGDMARGCVAGGVTGGFIGALGSMECRERTEYVTNIDRYLDDEDFDRPYRWRGGRVTYVDHVRYRGMKCTVYETHTRRGVYTEMACRTRGGWQHGYYEEYRGRGRW